jgi:hypothetical protein
VKQVYLLTLAGFLVGCGLLLGFILWFNGGVFSYSLDDAYIHLSLAENLPAYYGINTPEWGVSAPSSSIIWPWLLRALGASLYAPLILNLAAAFLVLALLLRIEHQINFIPTASALSRSLMVLFFASIINLFTLVFTGMEHTLHLAAVLAILCGLLERNKPWWFWAAIILAPLIRYEALALSMLALIMVVRQEKLNSVLAFVAMLIGPALFSLYLHHMGASWLPSSALSKSAVLTIGVEGQPLVRIALSILWNLIESFARPGAWVLALAMLLLAGLIRKGEHKALGLLVLAAGAAHFAFGKFGWFERYTAYIMALTLLAGLIVGRSFWARAAARSKNGNFNLALLLLAAGLPSLYCTISTPAAASQIYRYHGSLQMFLTQYWQDDVAAYDIGYIAWQNPHAVVDLFGLGSEEVRRIIRAPFSDVVIPHYLSTKKVDLLVADRRAEKSYPSLTQLPLATLYIEGRHVITGQEVEFYLLNPSRQAELKEKLTAFQQHLLPGTRLELKP